MPKSYPKCCLVVGAGASKGALVQGKSIKGIATPPLDKEFLGYAKELFHRRGSVNDTLFQEGKAAWHKLEKNLKRTIGSDQIEKWRLEMLASYLEARKNVTFQNRGHRPLDYQAALDCLNEVICYVLKFSGGTDTCDMHRAMIKLLDPTSIVSFNYDLILDQTLLSMERLNWADKNYNNGKSITLYKDNEARHVKWYPNRRRPSVEGIELYKLHGSMHWERKARGNGFRISGIGDAGFNKGKLFNYVHPPSKPFIIPPVAAKMAISGPYLDEIWTAAHKKLKSARSWIIWGYSFPQTDTLTTVLLKTCLINTRQKKRIIIINPDSSVKKRVEDMLVKVRVEQYSSAAEFLLKNNKLQFQDTFKEINVDLPLS